jgi:hypothetical protein
MSLRMLFGKQSEDMQTAHIRTKFPLPGTCRTTER